MLLTLILAATVTQGAETFCWTRDLKTATCIYSKEECYELVKLRREGLCVPVERWRTMRK
jgi:hypothetical protein